MHRRFHQDFDREIEMFHLPGHSIALIATLNVSKVANGTTTGSKQTSVLGFAVRWLTNKVMILHSSSSNIAKKVWILARTLANPSAVPTILHSKGRITICRRSV